jgi:hypothetical protein
MKIDLKARGIDMRDTEYRGKRKDTGEWITGYYARIVEADYIFTGKMGKAPAAYGSQVYTYLDRYEVIPETVGHYTGLMAAKSYRGDKPEDRKIFEGDIVDFTFFYYLESEIEEQKKGVIAFDVYSFVFKISEDEEWYLSDLTFDSENDIEIIGNIHDTPGLLDRE